MVTVVNKHVHVLYTFLPSLPLSTILIFNCDPIVPIWINNWTDARIFMNLDLQWLFYDRACNISVIPVSKIYLNKSEKALNLQDVFVIVNVCVIQIAVLRENDLREARDPELRNGLPYKRFISLVRTFAPAQKRIVFYKTKVMQSSFVETRLMRREIPLPACPCPPSRLIFIFRCLHRLNNSTLSTLRRQNTWQRHWNPTVPHQYFLDYRDAPPEKLRFDRISSAAILFYGKDGVFNWCRKQKSAPKCFASFVYIFCRQTLGKIPAW